MFGVLHDDVLEPLMHEIADLSRAYERVHRIQATVVPYLVPRFVVNNSSNLLYAIVVSLLSPSSSFGRTLASTSKSWNELLIYGFFYCHGAIHQHLQSFALYIASIRCVWVHFGYFSKG